MLQYSKCINVWGRYFYLVYFVLFQIIIPFFSIFVKDIYVLNEGCLNRSVAIRDGPKVRFWHSAEAEGLGRLTERVPNFGRMLCSRMKRRLLLASALNGQEMS